MEYSPADCLVISETRSAIEGYVTVVYEHMSLIDKDINSSMKHVTDTEGRLLGQMHALETAASSDLPSYAKLRSQLERFDYRRLRLKHDIYEEIPEIINRYDDFAQRTATAPAIMTEGLMPRVTKLGTDLITLDAKRTTLHQQEADLKEKLRACKERVSAPGSSAMSERLKSELTKTISEIWGGTKEQTDPTIPNSNSALGGSTV